VYSALLGLLAGEEPESEAEDGDEADDDDDEASEEPDDDEEEVSDEAERGEPMLLWSTPETAGVGSTAAPCVVGCR
jgi:hypothetical protein